MKGFYKELYQHMIFSFLQWSYTNIAVYNYRQILSHWFLNCCLVVESGRKKIQKHFTKGKEAEKLVFHLKQRRSSF